jgi:hypothetical protein
VILNHSVGINDGTTDIESVDLPLTERLGGRRLQINRRFESVSNESRCLILAQILAQYVQAAINHQGNHQSDATDKDSSNPMPVLILCDLIDLFFLAAVFWRVVSRARYLSFVRFREHRSSH